jgi:proteasome lid subunit RPN8/RPN11
MGLFGRRRVRGIATDALEFAREAAEDAHPNEYMGLLRGQPADRVGVDGDGYVITEVLFIPGTKSSPVKATVRSNLVPNDQRTMGSIHSHPNGVLTPSDQDIQSFGRGVVHIIMGAPYGRGDWRAYDREGEPRDLEVLEVDLEDPSEFFDFTQADLDREKWE